MIKTYRVTENPYHRFLFEKVSGTVPKKSKFIHIRNEALNCASIEYIKTYLESFTHEAQQSKFMRNVVTLATGAAIAQTISMAFSPLVTRLYGMKGIRNVRFYISCWYFIAMRLYAIRLQLFFQKG